MLRGMTCCDFSPSNRGQAGSERPIWMPLQSSTSIGRIRGILKRRVVEVCWWFGCCVVSDGGGGVRMTEL